MNLHESQVLEHKRLIMHMIQQIITDLLDRARLHDNSKLEEPETSAFAANVEHLRGTTYGSDRYKELLKELQPALVHHYAVNGHHPECYPNGVEDMTLVDLLEMLIDWKASTARHADGNILKSIEINTDRFKLSPQLAKILKNTVDRMQWR